MKEAVEQWAVAALWRGVGGGQSQRETRNPKPETRKERVQKGKRRCHSTGI